MTENRFEKLVQALKLLAARPEQLRQLFPDFVDVPDELALELDHWLVFGVDFVSQGLVSEEQLHDVQSIDDVFEAFSGRQDSQFWTMEAVASSEVWEQLRQKAKSILASMGIPTHIDHIEGIIYVPGKKYGGKT